MKKANTSGFPCNFLKWKILVILQIDNQSLKSERFSMHPDLSGIFIKFHEDQHKSHTPKELCVHSSVMHKQLVAYSNWELWTTMLDKPLKDFFPFFCSVFLFFPYKPAVGNSSLKAHCCLASKQIWNQKPRVPDLHSCICAAAAPGGAHTTCRFLDLGWVGEV